MQTLKGKIWTAIGLMSGTSMDGIDCALIRSDGEAVVERVAFAAFDYEPGFRKRIEAALEEAASLNARDARTPQLSDLESEITRRHSQIVKRFLADHGLSPHDIDLIGFHGQTVIHRPDKGFTVQLGDGQMLADDTGVTTVFDMRANDMAHGGQGAPLVPVYHAALAAGFPEKLSPKFPVCFVNIGGISNITWVGADGSLIAFDSGPGNALIDQWMHAKAGLPYDDGGRIASEGGLIDAVVDRYMASEFFARALPKSLDRSDFQPLDPASAELSDGARTLAHVSARAIIEACAHLPEPPEMWIISGGGRRNASIMDDLAELAKSLNGGSVIACEEARLNGDAMEAEAWAYLAIRSRLGLPLTYPTTTGCKLPVSGGVLATPVRQPG